MNGTLDRGASVLVDTNTIIEAHRTRAWAALAGGWPVETVEDCMTETQTGFQRRRPEQSIAADELRASLAAVHSVTDRERAELALRVQDIALDVGEESLWAHALGRNDRWVLCGVRLGFRERLVSLQELLNRAGHRPRGALKRHYTKKWLDGTLGEFVLTERGQ